MGITAAKVRRNSALFGQSARQLHLHVPADDADRFFAATAFSGITLGTPITLLTNGTAGMVSVYLALGTVTGTFNITVRVTGYDNTDTLVSNDVVLTQANTAVQTTTAFSYISSITYVALNSGTVPGTVTLAASIKVSDATDFATIGLPFQRVPAAGIRDISLQSATVLMPAYTYNADPGTITITATGLPTTGGLLVVTLADEYASYL